MRSLVSLDLSSSTGWAAGRPDGCPRFGTQRFPTGSDLGRTLDEFDLWLTAFLQVEAPAALAFEAPILTSGKTSLATARMLYSLAGLTELLCRRAQVRCFEVNLMTARKFFVGSGHAKKEDVIAAARRHGWSVKDDNQADALGVWAFAVHTLSPKHAARFALGQLGGRPIETGGIA